MGYIDQNLMSGERIVYQTKLHWIIYTWPALWLIIFIVLLMSDSTSVFAPLFFVASLIHGIYAKLSMSSSEFAVTNKRILIKVGIISRNSLEILLSKTEGIQVNQDIGGRIFNYGTIMVTGTGGSKQPFHNIEAPLDFRKNAQEQIAAVQETKGA